MPFAFLSLQELAHTDETCWAKQEEVRDGKKGTPCHSLEYIFFLISRLLEHCS